MVDFCFNDCECRDCNKCNKVTIEQLVDNICQKESFDSCIFEKFNQYSEDFEDDLTINDLVMRQFAFMNCIRRIKIK